MMKAELRCWHLLVVMYILKSQQVVLSEVQINNNDTKTMEFIFY